MPNKASTVPEGWEGVLLLARHYGYIRHSNARLVCGWIDYMEHKYPHERGRHDARVAAGQPDAGELLTWGEALCRVRFGPNWREELCKAENLKPDDEAVAIAKRWANGDWPGCIERVI